MPEYRQQSRQGQRYGQAQQGQHGDSLVNKIKQQLQSFASSGLKNLPANDLISIANEMGKHLKDLDLKTTQIRRFLDGVRKIDVQSDKGKNFNSDLVVLLKPKLAYAAGRDQTKIMPLMQVLEPAITAGSKTYEDFKRLLALIEGIVAYHRFHGGRDS
ncbi:MAG: type III-A CRISPR-associated protein Csm2 [Candidatus Jettenia sp. CY-1]|nr:MAG: type III-A CRISPR-associated protein Csm2 [Candidatus Jettenia sp. CY-1]